MCEGLKGKCELDRILEMIFRLPHFGKTRQTKMSRTSTHQPSPCETLAFMLLDKGPAHQTNGVPPVPYALRIWCEEHMTYQLWAGNADWCTHEYLTRSSRENSRLISCVPFCALAFEASHSSNDAQSIYYEMEYGLHVTVRCGPEISLDK